MSQENAEVVRSLYEAFSGLAAGGDVTSYVVAHYDPDCEYQPVEELEVVGGHEALVRWNERWFAAWDEFQANVDELIEVTDGVLFAALTVRGRGAASGTQVTQRIFHLCELRNGKVFRIREYLEREQALDAVGIRE